VLVINSDDPTKGIALCGKNSIPNAACMDTGSFQNVWNADTNRNIGTPANRVHDACPRVFLIRKPA
jgi:hypothetical protein